MSKIDEFNVENGLTGMKRDVIIKLIAIIRKLEKIKTIIGMSENHYKWRFHNFFVESRKASMVRYIENKLGGFTLKASQIDFLIFEKNVYRTICVDVLMNFGIWKMAFCLYNNTSASSFRFGVVHKDNCETTQSKRIGSDFNRGVACLVFAHKVAMANNDGKIIELDRFQHKSLADDVPVVASVEADMEKRTLYFFINNKQLYVYITDIPSLVHFAVSSGNGRESLQQMRVQRLCRTTAAPASVLMSVPFEWQAKPLK